ncbi:MAG: hypothetical protein RR275_02490 [Lachnospiraceae bacterium]
MRKTGKVLLGLAALGAAIGGGIVFFRKKKCCENGCEDCCKEHEADDFDLDDDLEPAADRGYVPLNNVPTSEADATDESDKKTSEEQTTDTTDNQTPEPTEV